MFILTFLSMFIIFSYCKIHQDNKGNDISVNEWGSFFSLSQENEELPSYDITHWVQQLHLQQCAIVEVGEGFCALFVELRSIPSPIEITDNSDVAEFFLGLCNCATLRSWILCSDELIKQRESDCIFTEATANANTSARVHRRLCDITMLSTQAPMCNCSIPMAGQQLYRTEGFPTCFRNPLPESLCSPRGICGIAQCSTRTVKGIHSPQCDPECHQKQPFCEEVGPWTSIPPAIRSLWSHWSVPICNNSCGKGLLMATAVCHSQVTGKSAIDCIGPGSFCCPASDKKCICEVTVSDDIMKATRFMEPCTCTDGCSINDVQEILLEREIDLNRKDDFDQIYEEADRSDQASLEEVVEYIPVYDDYGEHVNVIQRHLLARDYHDEDYNIWNDKESNVGFAVRQKRQGTSIDDDLYDDADYEDDEDDEDDEDEYKGDLDDSEEENLKDTDYNLEYLDYDHAWNMALVDSLSTLVRHSGEQSPGMVDHIVKSNYEIQNEKFHGKIKRDNDDDTTTEEDSTTVTEECDNSEETTEPLHYADYDSVGTNEESDEEYEDNNLTDSSEKVHTFRTVLITNLLLSHLYRMCLC